MYTYELFTDIYPFTFLFTHLLSYLQLLILYKDNIPRCLQGFLLFLPPSPPFCEWLTTPLLLSTAPISFSLSTRFIRVFLFKGHGGVLNHHL